MDEGDGKDQMDHYHRNEAISAVADDGFMAEEDDDYEDLYNDVNVGEGFLQSMRNNNEAGSRNEENQKVETEAEVRVEPILGTAEPEVSIPGLVGDSVAAEATNGTEVVVASNGHKVEAIDFNDVSQQVPAVIVSGTGDGLRVELGQAPHRVNDPEVPRGNNMSQGLLPPPNTLGNNEIMRTAMGNVNGVTAPGIGMVGNGSALAMPGASVSAGVGTGGGGGGGTLLFVGDLHWWTTDAELEAELCKYGVVKEVKFFDEKASGKSKGYCQVEFYDPVAATACKEGMNGYAFNGRPCVVEYASPYSIKRMGEAQVNRSQAQSLLAQAKRGVPAEPPNKPVVTNNANGGNFQGGENRGGFGRGNWGRGNGQGMGGRGPGGPMRHRPNGMGGRGLMGNGGGAFGQGMGAVPPMNMMHPQAMMGQGFEQAFGGPMARMGGYGGFPGAPAPPFPGLLSSFPPVGGVGLPGVAPHVNPAFFGRGMPMNGMGMMPNGVDGGHNMGMWDPNNGGWGNGEDMGGGRAAESSYGEEAASDHQYGEINHDRGARPNSVKEKERGSEREWSGSSDRRNRDDKDAGYERDIPREKDVGHGYDLPDRRHRDDRDTGREREREHHKERERSRDRDRERERERARDREKERERDRHRDERERYGDHRSRHRDEPEHDDEWNRGRSSRGHSKSRLSREDNHRSRSRDADYGKRRRLTTE